MCILGVLHKNEKVYINADGYVALTVHIGNNEQEVIYLRYVSDYTLVELGVALNDGQLLSIDLVQVNKLSKQELPKHIYDVEEGIPLFNTTNWNGKKVFDIETITEVVLKDKTILLLFKKIDDVKKIIRNRDLECAISDDGHLCYLLLRNLTDSQIETIEHSIEHAASGGYL